MLHMVLPSYAALPRSSCPIALRLGEQQKQKERKAMQRPKPPQDQQQAQEQPQEPPAQRKKKYGTEPIPAQDKRQKRLNVFFSDAEYAELLTRVKRKSGLSAYIRSQAIAGKTQLSVVVPEINLKAYAELARTAANLNQLARKLNSSDIIDLTQLQAELHAFRLALIRQGGDL